jgi:hypothetical protein
VGHRIFIFATAVALALSVAAPGAAVVATTVVEGGSAEVSLTVNSGFEPTFSAQPTGGLVVTFSDVIPVAGTEDFWTSTMTVNAGTTGPGQYQFPLEVRDSGGAVLTETVVVTVEAAGSTPTTSPPPATTTTTTTSTTTTTTSTTSTSTTLPPTSTATSTTVVATTESAPETTVIAIGTPLEPDDGFPTGAALVFGAAALVAIGAGLAFYAYNQRPRQRGLRLPSYSILEEEDGS